MEKISPLSAPVTTINIHLQRLVLTVCAAVQLSCSSGGNSEPFEQVGNQPATVQRSLKLSNTIIAAIQKKIDASENISPQEIHNLIASYIQTAGYIGASGIRILPKNKGADLIIKIALYDLSHEYTIDDVSANTINHLRKNSLNEAQKMLEQSIKYVITKNPNITQGNLIDAIGRNLFPIRKKFEDFNFRLSGWKIGGPTSAPHVSISYQDLSDGSQKTLAVPIYNPTMKKSAPEKPEKETLPVSGNPLI